MGDSWSERIFHEVFIYTGICASDYNIINGRNFMYFELDYRVHFIYVQRYDKIETALQGPFGAINPSQIQQLMQQVGVKDVMLKKRSVDFLFFLDKVLLSKC